jgi:lipoprotein-anchoring transpeptidase ErfK/SrfK
MHNLRSLPHQRRLYLLLLSFLGNLTLCLTLSNCQFVSALLPPSQPTPTPTIPVSADQKKQGASELQAFQYWITVLKNAGRQVDGYQQRYNRDQQALQQATTKTTYQAVLKTTQADVQTIELPAIKVETSILQKQLQTLASNWKNRHPHHDSYNNITYKMGFEYDNQTGIGTWIQEDLSAATTFANYQQIVANTNMYLTNFKAKVTNTSDKAPYDQVHQTDLNLINNYQKTRNEVLVVSLAEQSMRVYDHSRLIKAFQVTTGQPNKPTPPGSWWIESRQKDIIFKSSDPISSPYWYPDTPIHYAMQFHSNGYFIHDSWWRAEYGPNTQFPHQDTTGDSAADVGSHGCINMSLNDAQWVYDHVRLYTNVIVY